MSKDIYGGIIMKQEEKDLLLKDFGLIWWIQFAIYLIGVCLVFGVLIVNIINSL